jgi:uncharacterized protein (TIGR03086 family)
MIDLKPAGRALSAVVAQIGPDDLARPTPCEKYSVGELLAHVDEGARALGGDSSAEALDLESPTWQSTLTSRVERVGVAWADPAAWEGSSELAGLEFSNAEWGRIALTELVVHGWDLAQATGQQLELPEETVRSCYEHVAKLLTAPPVPGMWGPPVAVPDDASLLDQVIGITGRSPGVGGGE